MYSSASTSSNNKSPEVFPWLVTYVSEEGKPTATITLVAPDDLSACDLAWERLPSDSVDFDIRPV